ncbi:UNVERIFIED_ORG: hypothetical protein DFS12_101907 [Chitinophaga ginsengisegetis]|nr:hypothetical protein [Chitinophaga ginsengisegetis]MDR6645666.1 hypothetical protein [Chitinophaga ginsengisegetis]MDR6651742.1 hypothetical protein [Chitinophaga ginsengisegetis]
MPPGRGKSSVLLLLLRPGNVYTKTVYTVVAVKRKSGKNTALRILTISYEKPETNLAGLSISVST